MSKNRNLEPQWFYRIKVITICIILSNMFFSWKTKCLSTGISGCINPDYLGQNYLWSAVGFMVAVFLLFIHDCSTLPPRDD